MQRTLRLTTTEFIGFQPKRRREEKERVRVRDRDTERLKNEEEITLVKENELWDFSELREFSSSFFFVRASQSKFTGGK